MLVVRRAGYRVANAFSTRLKLIWPRSRGQWVKHNKMFFETQVNICETQHKIIETKQNYPNTTQNIRENENEADAQYGDK